MHPLVCLRIPSTAGRNDMPMRVVLAMTPMGLDHDDIAALEGLATHRTKEIVQAFHPTLHERTEQRFGMLIKWASITASATFGYSASPDNVTCWHIMALQ